MTAAGPNPLVVKLGGTALDNPLAAAALWRAVAEAHRLTGVVLVHGGGVMVDRHLQRLGMTSERREGIRVTPPDQMSEIAAVLAGRVNVSIVAALLAAGVPAVGLSLSDGFTTTARKSTRYTFDPGRVGEITGGDARLIRALLGAGFLPVLSSIAADDSGELLNVNADDAAAAVAGLVAARALVLLTDVPGVRGSDGRAIEQLTPADAEELVASGVIHGGMIVKVRAAAAAAATSGSSVVIASWAEPDVLARLAAGGRAGTEVMAPNQTAPATMARADRPVPRAPAATVDRRPAPTRG